MNARLRQEVLDLICEHQNKILLKDSLNERLLIVKEILEKRFPKMNIFTAAQDTIKMVEFKKRLDLEPVICALENNCITSDKDVNEMLSEIKSMIKRLK